MADLSQLISAIRGGVQPAVDAWNTIPTGASQVMDWAAQQEQPFREQHPTLARISDAVGLLTSAGPGALGVLGDAKSFRAIRTAKGEVLQHPLARTHLDIAKRHGVAAEDIADTGYVTEGKYTKGPLDRSHLAVPERRAVPDDFVDFGEVETRPIVDTARPGHFSEWAATMRRQFPTASDAELEEEYVSRFHPELGSEREFDPAHSPPPSPWHPGSIRDRAHRLQGRVEYPEDAAVAAWEAEHPHATQAEWFSSYNGEAHVERTPHEQIEHDAIMDGTWPFGSDYDSRNLPARPARPAAGERSDADIEARLRRAVDDSIRREAESRDSARSEAGQGRDSVIGPGGLSPETLERIRRVVDDFPEGD